MKITKVDAIQIEDKPADQPGWRPIVRLYRYRIIWRWGSCNCIWCWIYSGIWNDSGSGKIDNWYEPVGYRSYLGKII